MRAFGCALQEAAKAFGTGGALPTAELASVDPLRDPQKETWGWKASGSCDLCIGGAALREETGLTSETSRVFAGPPGLLK